ncbi:MAG: FecR domain-containing protein [Bacteroidota bacterium]|nr:FecR domain-containing protein [Bacteroidota bacterium]
MEFIARDADGVMTKAVLEGLLKSMSDEEEVDRAKWRPVLEKILSLDRGTNRALSIGEGSAGRVVRLRTDFSNIWRVAVVVLVVAGGTWLWSLRQGPVAVPRSVVEQPTAPAVDVLPGHNGAILTLADGSKHVLDSLQNGVIAKQGATTISLKDHKVSYAAGAVSAAAVTYNTMSTPRGREYQLVLADGTKVWLNAASSLTYPTAFSGQERVVEMTGEVYFEIKHEAKPFLVKVNGQTITDLGTRFNVNGYSDEPATVTTLIQGSVRVNDIVLRPGEQAAFISGGGMQVSRCDTSVAVAWVNGRFSFQNAHLQDLLRELARWYNVDVVYEGGSDKSTLRFSGEIGRNLSLMQLLRILAKTEVRYRLEGGNKLIILPGN